MVNKVILLYYPVFEFFPTKLNIVYIYNLYTSTEVSTKIKVISCYLIKAN
jgi:hypothetical protein